MKKNSICPMEPHDLTFYETHLKDFLPGKIIDVHTHLHLEKFYLGDDVWALNRGALWPRLACAENAAEDLEQSYLELFPDKQVTPLVFGKVSRAYDVEACTAYAIGEAKKRGWPYLYVTRPEWTAEEFERKIETTGAKGAKVYLNFAPVYIPSGEIRILDFIPHHQLEVLNAHKWVLMLHIPRAGRLGDPVNLEEMLLIGKRYPGIKTIIAHIGRAYCREDVGDAFERLSEVPDLYYDFSANCNEWVMEQLIRAAGPERILFGTDSPINRMRMGRITENGTYINLVRKGQYDAVTFDPHMREIEGAEADALTWFTYYEIDAFRRAAEACGLCEDDIKKVFYENAAELLDLTKGRRP